MKPNIRIISTTVFFCLLLGPLPSRAEPADAARSTIETATRAIYAAIRQQCAEIEKTPRKLHTLVDDILLPHADFERMARLVLGKNWRDATAEDRAAFVEQFRHLLIRTYATAVQMVSLESIHYLPAKSGAKPDTAIVPSEVRRPGEAMVTIRYYLYKKESDWLVYDIQVDGVSLVSNYRSAFAEEISKKGLPGLISKLEQTNNKPVVQDRAELIRSRASRGCT